VSGPDRVKAVVGDLPAMSLERGRVITAFIREHQVRHVLELGFFQGVSTCYIASALAESGGGHVVAIDRAGRLEANSPPTEELLSRLSLRDRVTLFYEYSSFNWRLYHFLAQSPRPEFDLVFLDGAHTWEIDGFAFLLAERLLAPGGHAIFDDVNWSIGRSLTLGEMAAAMPADEREAQQIRLVCEHLVRPHPGIDRFWDDGRRRSRARPVPRPLTRRNARRR
jgi:predicted O-methyltransferase YrrM